MGRFGLDSLEMFWIIVLGPLALGCLKNWLQEWRHDEDGRIFLTVVTAMGLLLVIVLAFDFVRRHVGL